MLYIACIGFLASVIDDLYQRYSAKGRRPSKLEQVQLDQKWIYSGPFMPGEIVMDGRRPKRIGVPDSTPVSNPLPGSESYDSQR